MQTQYFAIIYIEVSLTNEDGALSRKLEYNNTATAFLFKGIRYELNVTVIDSVRDMGLVPTLKLYL